MAHRTSRSRRLAPLAWVLSTKLGLLPFAALPLAALPLAALPLAALPVTLAAPALAQSTSAQARSLFREARRLMEKQRFGEACPKLQESLRLDPGMGTQFNLAHCWEKLGLTASAWGLFLDVAAEAEKTSQRKRERAARERAEALEPKLSRLRIDVPNPVPGLVVTRAGEEVGQAAWGQAMPIDPGTYRVEATAPDKRTWSGEVTVDLAGQTVPIEVPALEDVAPVVVEAPPEPPPAPVEMKDEGQSDSGSGRAVATWVLAGIGVGGVVTGTIFGLRSASETDEARSLCTGGANGATCTRDGDDGLAEQGELEDHRDKAKSAALISYIGLGVGGAALVTSAILLLTGSSSSSSSSAEDSTDAELAPAFGPEFAGVSLSGRF